ncbi:hypothetical protein CRYUN_Cryun08bG0108600 [Craigia yunnanensis]
MLDHRAALLRPFSETKTLGLWDINCTVKGGGISGFATRMIRTMISVNQLKALSIKLIIVCKEGLGEVWLIKKL